MSYEGHFKPYNAFLPFVNSLPGFSYIPHKPHCPGTSPAANGYTSEPSELERARKKWWNCIRDLSPWRKVKGRTMK